MITPAKVSAQEVDSQITNEVVKDAKYYDINNVSESMEELTPYIKVKNNAYVLDLPNTKTISSNLNKHIQMQLNYINNLIVKNNYVININTKVAKPRNEIQARSYGKNAVYFHWNYLELYLDAGLVQNITTSGFGALFGAGSFLVPVMAAHPVITLGVGVIFALIVNAISSANIRDGVILHLNFYKGRG